MDLLVDIGNTRIKWALWQNGAMEEGASLSHINGKASGLEQAWARLPCPEQVRVASVAGGAVDHGVAAACEHLWGIKIYMARPCRDAYGVTLAYADPSRLGVDRWLAMLAARHRGEGACLVVDCGTAVTLDVIDGDGAHLGGLIMPGLQLSWGALLAGTTVAALRFQSTQRPLGTDTEECIAAGILAGIVGAIERVHCIIQHKLAEPRVLLTGGDAMQIVPLLSCRYEVVPMLVLEGLALLRN
jgi:type III pantothenate kinase